MSVKNARRRATIRNIADTAPRRRKAERIQALLEFREQLAEQIAACHAHSLGGEQELLQRKRQIEAAIDRLDPRLYEAQWGSWLDHDFGLVHDQNHSHPRCDVCNANRVIAA